MGSNWRRRFTACDVKSCLLKLVLASSSLTVIYLYIFTPISNVRSLAFIFSDHPRTNATSTRLNATSIFSLTSVSKISNDYGFTTTHSNSARNNLTLFSNNTTQVRLNYTSSIMATTAAPVKTGPLYMTAIFMGRIGNQLFIYASLLGIARAQNRTAFIKKGTDLEKSFQITLVNPNTSTKGFLTVTQSRYAAFESRFMNLSRVNITLYGVLQVWRYFKHVEDDIRREFTFKPSIQKQIDDVLGKVKQEFEGHVIVGVHARRGDFLSSENQKIGYGVAKASYFLNALDKMRSLLNNTNVTFVVASDDLQWCRDNLNFSDVKILGEASAVLHFGVLANCDHVIFAGGTYGWWSAWLANGITIYYDRFLVNGTKLIAGVNLQDYYPPGWIAIGD